MIPSFTCYNGLITSSLASIFSHIAIVFTLHSLELIITTRVYDSLFFPAGRTLATGHSLLMLETQITRKKNQHQKTQMMIVLSASMELIVTVQIRNTAKNIAIAGFHSPREELSTEVRYKNVIVLCLFIYF